MQGNRSRKRQRLVGSQHKSSRGHVQLIHTLPWMRLRVPSSDRVKCGTVAAMPHSPALEPSGPCVGSKVYNGRIHPNPNESHVQRLPLRYGSHKPLNRVLARARSRSSFATLVHGLLPCSAEQAPTQADPNTVRITLRKPIGVVFEQKADGGPGAGERAPPHHRRTRTRVQPECLCQGRQQ